MENTLYLLILKNNQRDPSTVALESTTINIIFVRTYYLFNQFMKKNPPENLCNRKCYIPTAKDDNSNCER